MRSWRRCARRGDAVEYVNVRLEVLGHGVGKARATLLETGDEL